MGSLWNSPWGGSAGVTDHGALTGLGDDDHPQYVTHAEGDAVYAAIAHAHTSSDISDFMEAVQDVIGAILADTNTLDWTYNDPANTLGAEVKTQMSLTSDASGIKLSGDAASPGSNMIYSTDGSGVKGWFPKGAGVGDGLGPDGDKGDVTVGGTGTTLVIDNDAVSNAKAANMPSNTVKANATSATADPADLSVPANTVVGRKGGDIVAETIVTAQIADDQVTYAKIQNVTDARLLGRSAGSAGDCQEITVGSGLSLSGGSLTASGGSDPWTYVRLASDFSTSSATAVNITGMSVAVSADLRYEIEAMLFTRTNTATVGPRPGISWPTGMTDGIGYIQQTSSATANVVANGNVNASMLAPVGGLPNTTQSWPATIWATLLAGASPSGSFQLQLASETAGTGVTVKAGSWLRWRTIP